MAATVLTAAGMASAQSKYAYGPETGTFGGSDKVNVRRVTFKNLYKMDVTGNLFMPKDMDTTRNYAAIVVGHPMGAVKEQSANLYAAKLAERGFVTLSLDLSFWGENEGQTAQCRIARYLYGRFQRHG